MCSFGRQLRRRRRSPRRWCSSTTGWSDDAFAELHRRLWSWGGVPLILRKRRARVDLLRCAHRPDFIGEDGRPRYHAFDTLDLLTTLDLATAAPWWDPEQLYSGALWDDPERCAALLSADRGAARQLVQAIAELDAALDQSRLLPERLRRRLLVLSLLIAYLEDRGVLDPQLFGQCTPGAARFFEVLADGPGLVRLLTDLERRFNGDVFCMSEDEQAKLIASRQLARFAELVEGRTSAGGQLSLWRLYSFRDLPVELISHVYQHFVRADRSAVYTPPFLVRLMLDEALGAARLDRLEAAGEAILDPSCGSGVFLALAYKRLILHWRARNAWAHPSAETLRALLRRIRGVDLNHDAVELTAFSLCLAMCESLDTEALQDTTELFPKLAPAHAAHWLLLRGEGVGAARPGRRRHRRKPPVRVEAGDPGRARQLRPLSAAAHGKIPDKQVAYLFVHECLGAAAGGRRAVHAAEQRDVIQHSARRISGDSCSRRGTCARCSTSRQCAGCSAPPTPKVVAVVDRGAAAVAGAPGAARDVSAHGTCGRGAGLRPRLLRHALAAARAGARGRLGVARQPGWRRPR
jgi:hypothetical protein